MKIAFAYRTYLEILAPQKEMAGFFMSTDVFTVNTEHVMPSVSRTARPIGASLPGGLASPASGIRRSGRRRHVFERALGGGWPLEQIILSTGLLCVALV